MTVHERELVFEWVGELLTILAFVPGFEKIPMLTVSENPPLLPEGVPVPPIVSEYACPGA